MPTTNQLVGSGLHIGCSHRNWTISAERYIAGYRHTVAIFNLAITAFFLNRSLRFVELSITNHARGFFYGLNVNDRKSVKFLYKLGQIVSYHRWSGGFLTNIRRFKRKIKNFNKIPSFMVSMKLETRNYSVLREKARLKIPLICPLDSNSNPAYAEYPIPGNVSGQATVSFFKQCFGLATFSGALKRIKKIFVENRNKKKRIPQARTRRNNSSYSDKRKFTGYYDGRKRNRTAAVSFSGLYSTIELSPFIQF